MLNINIPVRVYPERWCLNLFFGDSYLMLLTLKKLLVAMATKAMEKLVIPKIKHSGVVFLILSKI